MIKSIIILLLFFAACTTTPYKSDYKETGQEIKNILQHDQNLTPAQKIILKHAMTELDSAQKQSKQNSELQNKVIAESQRAGAGTLIYWIIGVIAFGISAFIISKIMKLL
jgi:hypothetical protein